jgi:CheY-like chemotaxis protein
MDKVKILVVDDEEGIRLILRRILDPLGCKVVTAANFAEAVMQMSESPHPDFVFLDLRLPDSPNAMKTLENLQDIRRFNPDAPVVVLTGDPDERLKQVAYIMGCESFRQKTELSGQKDVWLAMQEACQRYEEKGLTKPEALNKILKAVTDRLCPVPA